MDLYKLQAIAQDYRPNIKIYDIKWESLWELKDFLVCAIFKKKEDNDRITEIFNSDLSIVAGYKHKTRIMGLDKWWINN